jgi:squalene-hopene/tetraprenyl-beta-curcumene cyclase
MLSLILAGVLSILPGSPGVEPNLVRSAQEHVDLPREIRNSIRWLRSAQNLETGAYDDTIEATALAVIAFAESPDKYRAVDGPFVRLALAWLAAAQRPDGSMGEVDADRARLTVLAAAAFRLGDGGHAEPHSRARKWLSMRADPQASETFPYGLDIDKDPERPEDVAKALLAERKADFSWDGPRGRVIESATRLIALSHLAAIQASDAGAPQTAPSATELPPFAPADREAALAALNKGAGFLNGLADAQGRFGAKDAPPDAGLTAMALAALGSVPAPRPAAIQGTLDKGLAWLVSLQHEDGSIHDGKLANYITSASILALTKAERPEYAPVVAKAAAFLARLQNDAEEGYSEGDLYYGGIGYGSSERPDLSNLQMALEALHESKSPESSAAYTKALHFLQRVQNRSESNDLALSRDGKKIRSGDDGGAAYLPGESKAGYVTLPDGTRIPRSYGSMTYALLKCYIFAGLERDDPRLVAAWQWCQNNYTLDVNPGFDSTVDPTAAYQGLFYYYLTLARALDAMGVEELQTPDKTRHAWRAELCGRLVALQDKTAGSWVNQNSPRWYEGNPLLASAYALLAIEAALPAQEAR